MDLAATGLADFVPDADYIETGDTHDPGRRAEL
jgi:hypothetical protein